MIEWVNNNTLYILLYTKNNTVWFVEALFVSITFTFTHWNEQKLLALKSTETQTTRVDKVTDSLQVNETLPIYTSKDGFIGIFNGSWTSCKGFTLQ